MGREADGVTFEGKEDSNTKKLHNEAQKNMKGLYKKRQQQDKRSICGRPSRSVSKRGPSRGRASGHEARACGRMCSEGLTNGRGRAHGAEEEPISHRGTRRHLEIAAAGSITHKDPTPSSLPTANQLESEVCTRRIKQIFSQFMKVWTNMGDPNDPLSAKSSLRIRNVSFRITPESNQIPQENVPFHEAGGRGCRIKEIIFIYGAPPLKLAREQGSNF